MPRVAVPVMANVTTETVLPALRDVQSEGLVLKLINRTQSPIKVLRTRQGAFRSALHEKVGCDVTVRQTLRAHSAGDA
jgi:hypothetical protein